MSPGIDLNADLAEGFPHDAALLARVTSASLSCGAHAGDRSTILAALREAKARDVLVGAHPGHPDPDHFGRRELSHPPGAIERLIRDQWARLVELADRAAVTPRFIKPHGALYNQAQRDPAVASEVVAAVSALGVPLVGQPGSVLERLADRAHVRYLREGFPERRYRPDGSLAPRNEPGAVLDDPAEVAAQAVRLARMGLDTLCLHGDAPRAVEWADLIRSTLESSGISARRWPEPWP